MTKKHFQAFAARIAADLIAGRTFAPADYQRNFDATLYAATTFADIAIADNPRFDRDRFMAACGFGAKGGR